MKSPKNNEKSLESWIWDAACSIRGAKEAHYYLSVNAMTQPMQVREDEAPYGTGDQ